MPDKYVLITGCSSGIGYCLATELGKSGYTVLATARSDRDVTKLKAKSIIAHQLDLADSQSIIAATDWAIKQSSGNIYGLVNNGAYGQPGAVEDLSREALVEQFQTNVFGTQELTNIIIPVMRNNDAGRIIQISSILGLICLPYRGAYNSSKYALEALTDTMRIELSGTNIKLSLIEPGPIETDFRKNALKMFFKNINTESSAHSNYYDGVTDRLEAIENVPFTLPSESVLKPTLHALASKKPKIRYKVTVPAIGLSFFKTYFPRSIVRFINQPKNQLNWSRRIFFCTLPIVFLGNSSRK